MPQSKWIVQEVEYVQVDLDEDSWIKVRKQITTGDYDEFKKALNGREPTTAETLRFIIVDWNFSDSSDNKLAVNLDNTKKIPMKSAYQILEKITETLGIDPLVDMEQVDTA